MAEPTPFFEAVQGSDGRWHVKLIGETPSRLPFAKAARMSVPVDDWIRARPAGATAAVARIVQALDDGEIAQSGTALITSDIDSASLHPAFVARLTDSEAAALALPLATRLALNLKSSGLIHKAGFRIDTSWTRNGGVAVLVRNGDGVIRHDGWLWRIPEPLYSTMATVDQVNAAPDEPARQIALAAMKRVMGDDASTKISADGVIERLRLAYASGFSLALQQSAGGFDFEPVLFGRERLDACDDGATIDEVEDGLLPPALAAGFARRFRAGDGARRTYLLDDGSLLFVDPQLARALGAVRNAQRGSVEQRRAFATAPERHIAEALRAQGDEPADAARLFIETQQFSARVAGIDIWRKPVMPWIKPKPGSWLPEAFGVRVGEPPNAFTITIPSERLAEVTAGAQNAVREERATFDYDGAAIPATQATLAALSGLAELTAAANKTDSGEQATPAIAHRYFLHVRDNLEEVAYAPLAPQVPLALPLADLPTALRSSPKPHQISGFHWLVSCWQAGIPGALLADDMGLGKTYQALALLAWLRGQRASSRPVLIVAPTGLLANWRAEIIRHLEPDALGRVISGYGADLSRLRDGARRDIDSGSSAIDPAAWAHAGVVLTTYETMRDYHLSFARQPFAAILYDEAQKLKNPASQITRAAKTLNAPFQLALTGTPVENRLQDLWSIFDVVHPGLLGSSKDFEQSYPAEPEALARLHTRLTAPDVTRPPALLRRLKEECLSSLPAKHIRAMPIAMPPRQAAAYDRVVARALAVKGTGERGRMLEVLHQLRGVSLHSVAPDDAGSDPAYFDDSARLAALFSILDEIAGKREKVLIFCESLAMQALLTVEIRRRYKLPYSVIRIHGGVAGDARQAAVDIFQERGPGFDAMILSPKAGGVGLTLTAANHVIHLSRWWNPAVEDQATDRAYRIGQTRDVTVYLPQSIHPDPAIAPASFDLKLHALMERKRSLSRGLLAPGDDESDTSALFDSVVVEETVPEEAPAPQPAPPLLQPAPLKLARPRLGLRLAPALSAPLRATPPSLPLSRPTWPRRMVYQAGTARDLEIFTGPVAKDPVRELIIVDPYAVAGESARQSLVDFVGILAGEAPIDTVRLITFDAYSVELREPESNAHQRFDLRERWRARFGSDDMLQHNQRSKGQDRNMHDREVRATTQSGRSLIWDLGRGIDGVMQTRHGCRVTLTED